MIASREEQREEPVEWSLPPLTPDELTALRADIAERGVLVPVVVDEAGTIIDGHSRVAIAQELGISYPQEVRAGLTEVEKRIEAVVLNLSRRQLTDAQKVLAGRAIEPAIAERARERMLAGMAADHGENLPEGRGRTRDEVAHLVGIGTGRTYASGKATVEQVERDAPHLMPHLVSGEMTLKEARAALQAQERGGGRSREEREEREQAAVARALRVLAAAMEANPEPGAYGIDVLEVGTDLRTLPDPAALAAWLTEAYALTDPESYYGGGSSYEWTPEEYEAAQREGLEEAPFSKGLPLPL